ncbi:hypothetical protein SAMN04488061_3023 [Filomicrobium insigne]|uniref:Peptidoglycan binding-like domain-containing protein n=1 Tax=Filomicrobium insigne TaxID=418854 RepID=A0A1H0SSH9_9HYPH|nr:trypsin inhibitor-like cysteine-rich domain-containing protein [Filomicrobium insigne]SDP44701.1 hypothetical protein SAMN04488061_3023 [Filomicrobium insigne]
MRSLFGLFLLAAGLGIGAYSFFPDAMEDHVRLGQLSRIITPVSSSTGAPAQRQLRSFSPSSPLFAQSSNDAAEHGVISAENNGPPTVVARRNLVRPATGIAATTPATLIETGTTYAIHSSPHARFTRIVEVQEELKRVGCYYGYLDGDWGPASKRAMQAFVRKVNASLPIEEPNEILLALLKAHPANTCAEGCDPGLVENANGQCVPNTVFAQDTSHSSPNLFAPPRLAQRSTTTGWQADVETSGYNNLPPLVSVSEAREAPPGRMSVGGPISGTVTQGVADGGAALPQIMPAPKDSGPELRTATAVAVADPVDQPVEIERPVTVTKKHSSRRRYSKETRQKRLMRQAFGDVF